MNPLKWHQRAFFSRGTMYDMTITTPGVLFAQFCPSFHCAQTFGETKYGASPETSSWSWMNLVNDPNMHLIIFCSTGTPRGLSCSLSQQGLREIMKCSSSRFESNMHFASSRMPGLKSILKKIVDKTSPAINFCWQSERILTHHLAAPPYHVVHPFFCTLQGCLIFFDFFLSKEI